MWCHKSEFSLFDTWTHKSTHWAKRLNEKPQTWFHSISLYLITKQADWYRTFNPVFFGAPSEHVLKQSSALLCILWSSLGGIYVRCKHNIWKNPRRSKSSYVFDSPLVRSLTLGEVSIFTTFIISSCHWIFTAWPKIQIVYQKITIRYAFFLYWNR